MWDTAGELFATLKEQGLTPARTSRQSRGADRPGGQLRPVGRVAESTRPYSMVGGQGQAVDGAHTLGLAEAQGGRDP